MAEDPLAPKFLLGYKKVIKPNQHGNVIGGHVQEVERNAILRRKFPVCHQCPSCKMHGGRNAQPQCDAEGRTTPTELKVSRKHKEEQNQPTFDQVDRLFENMGAGDDQINVVLRRISSSQRGQEHKNHADPGNERFAELGEGRVKPKHSAEYLAD